MYQGSLIAKRRMLKLTRQKKQFGEWKNNLSRNRCAQSTEWEREGDRVKMNKLEKNKKSEEE
jgi:hypothetical protein